MTDKTKKNIIKILAAIAITVVYFCIAYVAGNNIVLLLMPFFYLLFAHGNYVLAYALSFVPLVLLSTLIDSLLFDSLRELFKRPVWVYVVLSGNVLTLRSIFAIINGFDLASFFYDLVYDPGAALLPITPVVCLLGGVLFCFLIRLFKRLKAKVSSDSESAKEYVK